VRGLGDDRSTQQTIARSGITVTRLLCFRYSIKRTEVPHGSKKNEIFHFSKQPRYQFKMHQIRRGAQTPSFLTVSTSGSGYGYVVMMVIKKIGLAETFETTHTCSKEAMARAAPGHPRSFARLQAEAAFTSATCEQAPVTWATYEHAQSSGQHKNTPSQVSNI
jgi:hypothetical protein